MVHDGRGQRVEADKISHVSAGRLKYFLFIQLFTTNFNFRTRKESINIPENITKLRIKF